MLLRLMYVQNYFGYLNDKEPTFSLLLPRINKRVLTEKNCIP